MKLSRYLDRIGYSGSQAPSPETLKALMRSHVLSIPFENLDVQLGRPLNTDVAAAYDKIVDRRRGGWCYEMNGVFGWALREMGFDVMRMGAGVLRDAKGDFAIGNHLCLRVECEETFLVDVGFGGSLIAPFPLR
ncbi:MAG: arylamine N-acetyltransferase family protein, partial [Pseudomonadota bacterium]